MRPVVEVMDQAVEIARSCEIRVHDAIFAALTGVLEATSVTADERLAHRLKSFSSADFLGDLDRKAE